MAKSKKWMSKAFSNSHGQFKAKAARAGMSTAAYAKKEEHAPGLLGQQARLAERGMEARHKGAGRKPFRRHYAQKD
jgi:hypothetical protein